MTRRRPDPGLLIFALLSRSAEWEQQALELLLHEYGAPACLSPSHPFPWTNFYRDEVGTQPIRRYLATTHLLPREELPERKRKSIDLEAVLSGGGLRPVNIDAGCLTRAQLFLASTKDNKQRVYTGNGIYIEPTLYYQEKRWNAFPWSYPDFQSPIAVEWLSESRLYLTHHLDAKH